MKMRLLQKVILTSLIFFFVSASITYPREIPNYKIIAQDGPSFSIVVPPKTTKEELKALVFAFREARKNNTLNKYFPPSTKGGIKGDYAIVQVFILKDPQWATLAKLKKYLGGNPPQVYTQSYLKAQKEFAKEFNMHVRAYYWSTFDGQEEGSLGSSTSIGWEEHTTPDYEKLF